MSDAQNNPAIVRAVVGLELASYEIGNAGIEHALEARRDEARAALFAAIDAHAADAARVFLDAGV